MTNAANPTLERSSRTGLAGLIVVVVILGFLMVVSTSTLLLVRTEIQASNAGERPDLAQSAAMTGVLFYQTLLVATQTTFFTGAANYRNRLHFLMLSNKNQTNLAGQQIATWTGATPTQSYTNIATSAWMFASGTTLWTPQCPDVPSSSIFILKTYAVEDNGPQLASYVFVKSLGCYREIEGNTVIASHYCQLNARLEINAVSKAVTINRMRSMMVQFPNNGVCSFATSLPAPW